MVPFVVALLVHLFMAPARGSEISRGYLHGGVILDFIGEREGQRWRCVATDVLVMIMQCIMVGVDDVRLLVKRRRMGELGAKLDNSEEPRDNQNELAPRDLQNLDAEERGVVRQELLENATTGIGTDNSQDENEIGNEEAASLLADASSSTLAGHDTSTPTPNAPLDIFYSGNAIVAEVHLLDSLRAQWHQADSATATAMALQSVGFSAGYATSSPISRRLMRQLRPAGAG